MLHTVAKLHYEADMSQVDIARRLGVSTATISRLLQRARAEGIVRIEVLDLATPEGITTQLIEGLGLRDAAVIETPAAGALTALAAPLGALIKQAELTAGSVVAIGWGRAIREVIQAGLPRIPGVLTVAATVGMQQQAPHFIHAPYLPSSELREVFLGDATIRDSVALWDRTEVAIVGIGLPHAINPPEASAATLSEQALFHAAGDVIRHYFDAEGNLIPWEGESRMIAMSPAQLRAVSLVIGVAASPEKATAIIGAVRARLINALVTDTKTAQAVLEALLPR
ncbi:MAG: MarR family transcriptional regulator [Mesorhizobium sp.]|nr:MAG: MarR family transcriptional regulator [Mesorhizobium sp.]